MSGGMEEAAQEEKRRYVAISSSFPYVSNSEKEVNHPSHYIFGKFEVIDVLEDWFPKDPILWQVGKYIARSPHKGTELVDLKKAMVYLQRKINMLEGGI